MKVNGVKNVQELFQVIDGCTGRVELVTGQGDRLNLKSKLSQFVAMEQLFTEKSIAELELEVIAYEPEDNTKLINYLMGN